MQDDVFVSLQEAAMMLEKSSQTVRRMIKRKELRAQKMRTPQGFQYVVSRDDISKMLPESPIQEPVKVETEAPKEDPTNQTPEPTTQQAVQPIKKPEIQRVDTIDPNPELLAQLAAQHKEKMTLLLILEKLQWQLDFERRRPRTLLAHIMDWLYNR